MIDLAAGTQAASGSTVALETRNITKVLPLGQERISILRGITLSVRQGEMVAIVGPSGSGKSTLLGIIAGLDSPTAGQILVDAVDITKMNETRLAALRNTSIGMVFQSFNLIPTLTAQENVEVPLYVGRRFKNPPQRAREVLQMVGMGSRLRHTPNQLSGGEQQRVAIARALGPRPSLIIMDEPTGNLDRSNGENLLALIRDLRATTGVTFIIATHDAAIAAAADRAIQIKDGALI